MKLKEYFDNVKGYGVLATADASGKANAAVYASPHVMDEKTEGRAERGAQGSI